MNAQPAFPLELEQEIFETIKSGIIVLAGHALLAIVAPFLDVGPVSMDYTLTLPSALPVGVVGGGILFCTLSVWHAYFRSGQHEEQEVTEAPSQYMDVIFSVTAAGIATSVIGGLCLRAAGLTALDIEHAAYVGVLGGALVGSLAIRLEV